MACLVLLNFTGRVTLSMRNRLIPCESVYYLSSLSIVTVSLYGLFLVNEV